MEKTVIKYSELAKKLPNLKLFGKNREGITYIAFVKFEISIAEKQYLFNELHAEEKNFKDFQIRYYLPEGMEIEVDKDWDAS